MIRGENGAIYVGDKLIASAISWEIRPSGFSGEPIDYRIFGNLTKEYKINIEGRLNERVKHWFRRWERHNRPTWRKPPRAAYPASKHRRMK